MQRCNTHSGQLSRNVNFVIPLGPYGKTAPRGYMLPCVGTTISHKVRQYRYISLRRGVSPARSEQGNANPMMKLLGSSDTDTVASKSQSSKVLANGRRTHPGLGTG